MVTEDPSSRVYRVTDMFTNGEAILDAEDNEPKMHRRTLPARDLPPGATMGAAVRRYDNGRVVLVHQLTTTLGEIEAELALHPSLLGDIIKATVESIAQTLDLTLPVAAHIMYVWLRLEYHL